MRRRKPRLPPLLFVIAALGVRSPLASAESEAPHPDGRVAVAAQVGVLAPIFFLYERPGAVAAATVAWQVRPWLAPLVSVDVGYLSWGGARRTTGSLGAGVRLWPSVGARPWIQLGLGVTGYREHIGVDLPQRRIRAVDLGGALTADVAVGLRLTRRWELTASYDHNLIAGRGMDFAGSLVVAAGRWL